MHCIISLVLLLGTSSLAIAGTVNTATISPTTAPTMTSCPGYEHKDLTFSFPVPSSGAPPPVESIFVLTTLTTFSVGPAITHRLIMNQPSDCAIDSATSIAFTLDTVTAVMSDDSGNTSTWSEERRYARTEDASVTTTTKCTSTFGKSLYNCGITVQESGHFEHSGYHASVVSDIIIRELYTPVPASATPTLVSLSTSKPSKGNHTDGDKPGSAPVSAGLFLPGAIVAAAALIGAVML